MQSQRPPEGPYIAPVTQSQDSSFHFSNTGNSQQTSASDPIRVLKINTSEGSFDVRVDVHQASRFADERRARNARASARLRQRRKEKEKEAKNATEKFQTQTRELERRCKELELERNFYRDERNRLCYVVFNTPGLRHHAMPSPQSMQSASFQGLMPQMADSQAPSQTAFHVTDPTSERVPKRRCTSARGGYKNFLPRLLSCPFWLASHQGQPFPHKRLFQVLSLQR
jgi:hypothetical protein